MSREKMIDKIRKMMELSKNNSNDNEAQAALLKAQEIMAKYNIEVKEVEIPEDDNPNVVSVELSESKGITSPWKRQLLHIISKNFRCECYFNKYGAIRKAVFVGLEEDVEIAIMMYMYILSVIQRGMYKCYRKFRDKGEYAQGVRGDYAIGFLKGLEDKFVEQVEKNNWGLVLTVHPAVNDHMNNLDFKELKSKAKLVIQNNSEARNQGYKDGKNLAEPHTRLEGDE